jgi:hypothetical protein
MKNFQATEEAPRPLKKTTSFPKQQISLLFACLPESGSETLVFIYVV